MFSLTSSVSFKPGRFTVQYRAVNACFYWKVTDINDLSGKMDSEKIIVPQNSADMVNNAMANKRKILHDPIHMIDVRIFFKLRLETLTLLVVDKLLNGVIFDSSSDFLKSIFNVCTLL